eukprot:m.478474 g.478474  ORF g.478474 m.478474 type:complete len:91 (+) comp21149_c0_seq1:549-821(+)
MSTSQKHRDFVREPMGDKPVSDIAGVGPRATEVLEPLGFSKAFHLLGQFLVLDKDEEMFQSWLSENVSSMNSKHRGDCYNCLSEWAAGNL